MSGDNGKGLRALFYGLCCLWDIDVWDEEQVNGPMPADFYLPPRRGPGVYVIIAPEPQDRQVEIAAAQFEAKGAPSHRVLVLDREDLYRLRLEYGPKSARALIGEWLEHGTHADAMRKRTEAGS